MTKNNTRKENIVPANTVTTTATTAKKAVASVWKKETVKAVYNHETKTYDKVETIGFTARYQKATKATKTRKAVAERVIVRCKGCCVVCYANSKGGIKFAEKNINTGKWDAEDADFMQALDKAKYTTLKKYLAGKHNFATMSFETLKAKCIG